MADDQETASAPAAADVTELRVEWTFDAASQMVMLTVRHRLELPSAAKVIPMPFPIVKLMAGQVLTIEAQMAGLIPPQGRPQGRMM